MFKKSTKSKNIRIRRSETADNSINKNIAGDGDVDIEAEPIVVVKKPISSAAQFKTNSSFQSNAKHLDKTALRKPQSSIQTATNAPVNLSFAEETEVELTVKKKSKANNSLASLDRQELLTMEDQSLSSNAYTQESLQELRDSLKKTTLSTSTRKQHSSSTIIPESGDILIAKKRRENAKSKNFTGADDFIGFEEEEEQEEKVDKDSRLIREDQFAEDEDFEDYREEKLKFGMAAVEDLKLKERVKMQEYLDEFNGDLNSDDSEGEEEEDEETINWEKQQIQKGVNNQQLDVEFLRPPEKGSVMPEECGIASFKEIMNEFQKDIDRLQTEYENMFNQLAVLMREKNLLTADEEKAKMAVDDLGKRFYFYQELDGWLDGYASWTEEKLPILVEEFNNRNITEISQLFDDTRDEYRNVEKVLSKFENWAYLYTQDYREAFVEMNLAKLLQPHIKQSLIIEWDPCCLFKSDDHAFRELDSLQWHQTISRYGTLLLSSDNFDIGKINLQDESHRILQNIVEIHVIDYLNDLLVVLKEDEKKIDGFIKAVENIGYYLENDNQRFQSLLASIKSTNITEKLEHFMILH